MQQSSTRTSARAATPRWAVWAAYAVPLAVLPSAIWRTTVVLDGDVTVGDGGWYLLLLSGLSMGVALLTLGLVHDWGERVPGWVPLLGGRTVPNRAAVIPAAVGASLLIGISLYAVLNISFHFVDRGPVVVGPEDGELTPPGPGVLLLYLPMPTSRPVRSMRAEDVLRHGGLLSRL